MNMADIKDNDSIKIDNEGKLDLKDHAKQIQKIYEKSKDTDTEWVYAVKDGKQYIKKGKQNKVNVPVINPDLLVHTHTWDNPLSDKDKEIGEKNECPVCKLNGKLECNVPTAQEKEEILAQDFKEDDDLPDNLFNSLKGSEWEDLKVLLTKSLKADQPVNILMISNAGLGKTMSLEEIEKLDNAYFYQGQDTSLAGLRDELYERFDEGDDVIILIDEIEKMDDKDLQILSGLGEQGRVKTTKGNNTQGEINLNATIIGACNDLERLPFNIIDRFEAIEIPEQSEDDFEDILTNILVEQEGLSEDVAEYIAENQPEHSIRQGKRIARLSGDSKDEAEKVIDMINEYGVNLREKVKETQKALAQDSFIDYERANAPIERLHQRKYELNKLKKELGNLESVKDINTYSEYDELKDIEFENIHFDIIKNGESNVIYVKRNRVLQLVLKQLLVTTIDRGRRLFCSTKLLLHGKVCYGRKIT